MTHARPRWRTLGAGSVLALAAGLLAPTTAAQAAGCTPTDVSNAITKVQASDAEGVLGGTNTLRPWQNLRIDFEGALSSPNCAGDSIVLTLPAYVSARSGDVALRSDDGVDMGTLSLSDRRVKITFNDFIEKRDNVKFSGWIAATSTAAFTPDADTGWSVKVGNRSFPQTVTASSCWLCGVPITTANSWSAVAGDRKTVFYGVESAEAGRVDEPIMLTQTVRAGQAILCGTAEVFESGARNAWGWPTFPTRVDATVITCNDGVVQVSLGAREAGRQYSLMVDAAVTKVQSSYSGLASIYQDGNLTEMEAVAEAGAVGGGATGSGSPKAPTTTPKPDPAPSGQTGGSQAGGQTGGQGSGKTGGATSGAGASGPGTTTGTAATKKGAGPTCKWVKVKKGTKLTKVKKCTCKPKKGKKLKKCKKILKAMQTPVRKP